MLPRQSALDKMLLYENLLYETLLIHITLTIKVSNLIFVL